MKEKVNDSDTPRAITEGIEEIIKRDLEKHKGILERTKLEKISFKEAVSAEVRKRKHYKSLIGGGKFNDDALRKSMDQIAVNITHMDNKAKAADDKIAFETNIVDTLQGQLDNQLKDLRYLADYRRKEQDAINSKLGNQDN